MRLSNPLKKTAGSASDIVKALSVSNFADISPTEAAPCSARAGNASPMLVSCSQDKKVLIWTRDAASRSWTTQEIVFGCALWRVSWSVTGNILAVSGSDNLVTLWKQNLLGKWEQLGQLADNMSAH